MRYFLTVCLSLALPLAASSAPAQAVVENPRRVQISDAIIAAMKEKGVPGVSIAVVNDYRIDWADGFGLADIDDKRPVTPTTLFQAASISKPVTALGALRMVELGKLKLEDDVNPRLTSWHIPDSPLMVGRPVTLRRLLSHTAGLSVHGFAGYEHGAQAPTLVQLLTGTPPANSPPVKIEIKPGYKFQYSGGGYSVVQQLLIDVTAMPFPEFMRQQVLDPLGMSHSTYEQPLPDKLFDQATSGHDRMGKPLAGHWHVYPEMAAAGLWTTPSDLALVVIDVAGTAAGRNGKLLSPGMTAEMLTAQSGAYGLGFGLKGDGRSLTFSHGGANAGFRCLLMGIPATGQGAVIMTNGETGDLLLAKTMALVSQVYAWP